MIPPVQKQGGLLFTLYCSPVYATYGLNTAVVYILIKDLVPPFMLFPRTGIVDKMIDCAELCFSYIAISGFKADKPYHCPVS